MGALKGMNDAIALADSTKQSSSLEEALELWNQTRTGENNRLVEFGNQLGQALVKEIPDWSKMNATSMEKWFNSIVTISPKFSVRIRVRISLHHRAFNSSSSALASFRSGVSKPSVNQL